jgi:predicted kinase
MEAVIFIGIQGAGKSTFFKQSFVDTHIRINGDMLRTKRREQILIEACLRAKQSFVVDKTNATREQRARYIAAAKSNRFRVVGYYFRSNFAEALKRNDLREGKSKIPEKGLRHFLKRLETPVYAEGFDRLFYVWINDANEFVVEAWKEVIELSVSQSKH